MQGLASAFEAYAALWRALQQLGHTARRFLCDALRTCRRMCTRHNRTGCCIDLPASVHKRADPLIYDQFYLLAHGLAVTWDNPDIQLYRGGTPANPWDLAPDTDYQVRVRVWNGSYDAPAIGLPVHLSFLGFGVGAKSTHVGTTPVDLGAKGSPTCPAYADFTWHTPGEEGHYCLQAWLEWYDDANPDNNLGQKNTNVGTAHSPAVFDLTARNEANTRRVLEFEVDTYELPQLPPCADEEKVRDGQSRLEESRARWRLALAKQHYGLFPVGREWNVTIEPASVELDPWGEARVQVSIEPLDPAFKGRRAFNVHAFAAGIPQRVPAGGVTLFVERG